MSARCGFCNELMEPGVACTFGRFEETPELAQLDRVPNEDSENCHDCNAAPGGNHHPGCDAERCPACRGQAISCGCADERADDDDGVSFEDEAPEDPDTDADRTYDRIKANIAKARGV